MHRYQDKTHRSWEWCIKSKHKSVSNSKSPKTICIISTFDNDDGGRGGHIPLFVSLHIVCNVTLRTYSNQNKWQEKRKLWSIRMTEQWATHSFESSLGAFIFFLILKICVFSHSSFSLVGSFIHSFSDGFFFFKYIFTL